jgi:hypothetical protein
MKIRSSWLLVPAIAALTAAQGAWSWEVIEFDEFEPIIEINAEDGDIGFHMLLDGEPWNVTRVYDGDGDPMLRTRAVRDEDLDEQGITEFFIESAEPICFHDATDPDYDPDEVVDLEEFLDRFEEGTYTARGRTLEGDRLFAEGEFTHDIPAAPITSVDIDWVPDDGALELEVDIEWQPGVDLGKCEIPDDLLETHPMDVEVVRYEIVVEPDEDQLDEINAEREVMDEEEIPDGVFSVQIPAEAEEYEVEVPEEWMAPYIDAGVTIFKYEVGAKEASGNQTFHEDEFDIYDIED